MRMEMEEKISSLVLQERLVIPANFTPLILHPSLPRYLRCSPLHSLLFSLPCNHHQHQLANQLVNQPLSQLLSLSEDRLLSQLASHLLSRLFNQREYCLRNRLSCRTALILHRYRRLLLR